MTPEEAKIAKVNDVVQISRHKDAGKIGALVYIIEIMNAHAGAPAGWGARVLWRGESSPQPLALPWSDLVATGGRAAIDYAGKSIEQPKPATKHHP